MNAATLLLRYSICCFNIGVAMSLAAWALLERGCPTGVFDSDFCQATHSFLMRFLTTGIFYIVGSVVCLTAMERLFPSKSY